MVANPAQAGGARVALRDGVRRDQAERASVPKQVERPPVEVRDQVGVAVTVLMELEQPLQVVRPDSRL